MLADARKALSAGIDPKYERKFQILVQIDSNATFEAVAVGWLAKREREGLSEAFARR